MHIKLQCFPLSFKNLLFFFHVTDSINFLEADFPCLEKMKIEKKKEEL